MRAILALLILMVATNAACAQAWNSVAGGAAPPVVAFSGLPGCSAANKGQMFVVTDALLPAALAIVAAGGAVNVIVFCNGTSWIVN